MIESSIQVRRVTEKVKRFFEIFGFRQTAVLYPNRSVIRGSKRLGLDEFECVVTETSRGTSVGFYKINTLQGLIYSIPFVLLILFQILAKYDIFKNIGSISTIKLFTGEGKLDYKFVLVMLFLGLLPFIAEYLSQQIRLNNIKARFSFFTRDAIWETREIPTSLIILQSIKSAISQGFFLAILYFLPFAATDDTLVEITSKYQTNDIALRNAITDTFSITVGIIVGLVAGDKALKLRKNISKFDPRNRISGSLLERQVEAVLFGIQAAIYTGIIFLLFLSQTFFVSAPLLAGIKLLISVIVGGIIAGLINSEDEIWNTSFYAIIIFFSSIVYIFKTGNSPEYAFIVVLQLFLLPIPFILHFSKQYQKILLNHKINSYDWYYDLIPLTAFFTVYLQKKRKLDAKKRYESQLELGIDLEHEIPEIKINKSVFSDQSSIGYKIARHYFELLMSYTASFEEDVFIVIPTNDQLLLWWTGKSDIQTSDKYKETLDFIDQLLWDETFIPSTDVLQKHEAVAKNMVLAIQ